MKRPLDEQEEDESMIKRQRGEGPKVELRILLQSKNAGAIIGKGGSNIKRLRNDYKASVTVPDSDGPERILTIATDLGTVLEVLLEVIPMLEDYKHNDDLDFECELRMLVHQSQAGCIIGRAGFKIKELREKTGANIRVFSQCCPNSTDRIVLIQAKPRTAVGCVEEIFELLQSAPPKGPQQPYDPNNFDVYYAQEYGGFTPAEGGRRGTGNPRGSAPRGGYGMRGGRDDFGMGMGMGGRSGMRGGRGGMGMGGMGGMRSGGMGGMGGGGMGFGGRSGGGGGGGGMGGMGGMRMNSGGMGRNQGMGGGGFGQMGGMQDFGDDMGGMDQGMMFGKEEDEEVDSTQVTIPKDLAGAIIGKGGSRITEIRRQSNAQIVIDEPLPGSSDRIITITGTQQQIQNAQYLLQMRLKGLAKY
ncbi:heterogeneous nuclear ribonucleoprotein K-like isoform X2 [Gigantopelta aegis]|nr:heterogeneous nuclear ribonucleoprotein K-like isoform X2 [Gigantopelta aegis]